MATFIINTKTELWKCRKTAAYWITIIGAAFIPLFLMVAYIADPKEFMGDLGKDHWDGHIKHTWQAAAALFFPFYVVLVTSLVVQIEYRNNTWKQVYASPRSYADIFFSKFFIIQFLILGCIVLFNVFVIGSAYMANSFRSEYQFFDMAIPWQRFWSLSSRLYVAILAMTAIQYWISLRIKNYIAPLGIALALIIIGFIILGSDKVIYYPYAYTAVTFFKNKGSNGLANHEIYSLVWFAVILLLAFWDTSRRKERG